MDRKYVRFIADLKRSIIQSRYVAARLANKEQLLLYFKTGMMLSEKIAAEKWGAKVLEQIAEDLQKQLPGLRGFSHRNLLNMKRFFTEYQLVVISQSATAKIGSGGKKVAIKSKRKVGPLLTIQPEAFWSISFTHHMLVLNKCKTNKERFFYIEQAATQFWSVAILEHYLTAKLYTQQGKLPNNFTKTLPDQLKPSALQVFQDEYLMDFIVSDDAEDERVFENKVVFDIKNFIMRMGKGGSSFPY